MTPGEVLVVAGVAVVFAVTWPLVLDRLRE